MQFRPGEHFEESICIINRENGGSARNKNLSFQSRFNLKSTITNNNIILRIKRTIPVDGGSTAAVAMVIFVHRDPCVVVMCDRHGAIWILSRRSRLFQEFRLSSKSGRRRNGHLKAMLQKHSLDHSQNGFQ